jgi:hypothetical protein
LLDEGFKLTCWTGLVGVVVFQLKRSIHRASVSGAGSALAADIPAALFAPSSSRDSTIYCFLTVPADIKIPGCVAVEALRIDAVRNRQWDGFRPRMLTFLTQRANTSNWVAG